MGTTKKLSHVPVLPTMLASEELVMVSREDELAEVSIAAVGLADAGNDVLAGDAAVGVLLSEREEAH
jgi:hypothetical protein